MRRRLFNLAAALSLLLFVAVLLLWRGSWRGGFSVDATLASDRLTLRSEEGRFILFGPPARPASGDGAPGEKLDRQVRSISNDQVEWGYTAYFRRDGSIELMAPSYRPLEGPLMNLWPAEGFDHELEFDPDLLILFLLDAVEDPDRFVAAHLLLHVITESGDEYISRPADGRIPVEIAACALLSINRSATRTRT